MFCPSCGSKQEEGARFCEQCGTYIEGLAAVASTPAPAGAANAATQVNSEDTSQLGDTDRIRVVAPPVVPEAYAGEIPPAATPPTVVAPTAINTAPSGPKKSKATVIIVIAAILIALAAVVITLVVMLNTNTQPVVATSPSSSIVSDEDDEEDEEDESSSGNSSSGSGSSGSGSGSGSSGSGTSGSGSAEDAGFILPESDIRDYSKTELEELSLRELYLARNEIYARHGRGFKNEDLRSYFESQEWYEEIYTPEEFDAMASPLNAHERHNSDLMLSIEQENDSPYL